MNILCNDNSAAGLMNQDDSRYLPSQYVHKAMTFLAKHTWIYNFKNTDIFVNNVLEDIPHTWKEPLLNLNLSELSQVPYGFVKKEWPLSLQEFVLEATELALNIRTSQDEEINSDDIEIPAFIRRKMCHKKLREVKHMSFLISVICQKYHCDTVIDIGSGLGYLDQVLHHNFGLTVIGIDCEAARSHGAESRVQQGLCKENIYHSTYKVDNSPECVKHIKELVSKLSQKKTECCCATHKKGVEKSIQANGVIMVGLHSCGSLLPNMMKLFLQLPELKLFFCVGCCYHRMNTKDFPISKAGKASVAVAKSKYPLWSPSLYGFRLGSQDARAHWAARNAEDHELHTKNVAFRGILECFLQLEDLHWSRPKRRFAKLKVSSSFEDYALLLLENEFWNDEEKEKKMKILLQIFQKQQHLFPYINILALLQVLLQPIWEGVILQDRNIFLLENDIDSQLIKVCSELISPRNIALYGIKRLHQEDQ